MELVINDRRGKKREEEAAMEKVLAEQPQPEPKAELVDSSKRVWKDICYMLMQQPMLGPSGEQQGVVMVGRAVALRSDGFVCVGDYLLPPDYPEDYNWTKSSKERVVTFLKCSCVQGVACPSHQILLAQWRDQDYRRMSLWGDKPIPLAMEAFYKVMQQKAQSRIVLA